MPILKNLPEDVSYFKPIEGDNDIVIVPFTKEGDYRFEYQEHLLYGGPMGTSLRKYICPKIFGSFCPICAAISSPYEVSHEIKMKYKPRNRVIYNVISLMQRPRKVQLWNISHFFSQSRFESFGLNINIPTQISFFFEKKGGKYVNYHYQSAFFKMGIKVHPDLLKQVINIYDHLYLAEYDEIEQAFNAVYQPLAGDNIIQSIKPIEKKIIQHSKDYKRVVDLE
jgi:hypothetical protein